MFGRGLDARSDSYFYSFRCCLLVMFARVEILLGRFDNWMISRASILASGSLIGHFDTWRWALARLESRLFGGQQGIHHCLLVSYISDGFDGVFITILVFLRCSSSLPSQIMPRSAFTSTLIFYLETSALSNSPKYELTPKYRS
jgi:hypothetical protein